MNRRTALRVTSAAGLTSSIAAGSIGSAFAYTNSVKPTGVVKPLPVPNDQDIPVAFLISDGTVVIDIAGPWEVFQDVAVSGRKKANPFRLFTVAESTKPIVASSGLTIVPTFSFESAPRPKVVVIPAQSDPSEAVLHWVREIARTADMTMSICTGAFLLAKTGLLNGKIATTHHGSYAELAIDFPKIAVERGARFVDLGHVATSGGLSSGIDLALHVVQRYFGYTVAADTADTMEYQGVGWTDPHSNFAYGKRRKSTATHHVCAVCEMDVALTTGLSESYDKREYYFCGEPHKTLFDLKPLRFAVD